MITEIRVIDVPCDSNEGFDINVHKLIDGLVVELKSMGFVIASNGIVHDTDTKPATHKQLMTMTRG